MPAHGSLQAGSWGHDEGVRGYIAGYLTSLIEGLDTTDYLREWLARESPVEVPAGFEGGRWLRDEIFD